ncbi:amidohydrolase family protein [Jiella sonneratiae]|uniref:Amidohydrolase family protein n=1 Tax=Jiella sonneratiae TaxID=2816856 RepID=A0ABS3J2F0_9HYPH|nr:amidohydrolase family protein [Jiella sonneratiae]MBO0903849.1 amidohydrolase family protein [Jiella sonneratiae]
MTNSNKLPSLLLTAAWGLDGPDLVETAPYAVLVENDRIAWTGSPEALPERAASAVRHDLGAATLLPGLIDAHMHTFGMDSLKLGGMDLEREAYRALRAAGELHALLRAGFTTARCLGSSVGPDIARAIAEGHVPGPRLLAAGAFLSATDGTWDTPPLGADHPARAATIADGADAFRRAVRARLRAGADFIKLGLSKGRPGDLNHAWGDDPFAQVATMSLDEVRAATDEAHRNGVLVSAHAIGEAAVRLALDGDVDIVEHGYAITEETRARLVESGRPVVTTLSQLRCHREAYERFGYPEAERAVYDRHWQAMSADFVAGLAAGVRFVLGTDLIGRPTHPLADAAREFAIAVELGMEKTAALRAGTVESARAIGLGGETGQISAGYCADMVAVAGRLDARLAALTAPVFVMRGGVRV